jgi:hypothetical protein
VTAWLWALGVVITFGLAAPVVFAYAAVKGRKRSWYIDVVEDLRPYVVFIAR